MESGAWLRRAVAVGSAAALMILGTAGLRADGDTGAGSGRAVRLSTVDGQVQVAQNGEVLADHALANTPLFEGTQVTTGEDGRAEIQFEDGGVARIPPDSSLTLTVLKPGDTEITLDSGMGYFELQDGSQSNPARVRFGPNVVTVSGFTVLRVNLDQGPGELAVFSGNAHIDGTNGASMDVRGGESVALNNLNLSASIEPDSWDTWNADRDQALTAEDVGSTPAATAGANGDNPAWNDLNSNGTWYNVPDQGYVWSPYEASNAGWDPYGSGYWMMSPAYGYMWVSGYSWGYMPYQCGAWNWYDSFGWGWAPGGVCNPWWGGGGWYFNVGYIPTWYRLPVRPHPPRPINPHPVQLRATGNQPVGLRPIAPIITVHRREPLGTGNLPPRAVGHPILIGGVMAQPVRPIAPVNVGFRHPMPLSARPVQGGNTRSVPLRTGKVQTGTVREGYMPAPSTAPVARPGYAPFPQPGVGTSPGSVTVPRPSPSGGGYHPAPMLAPAPRPSGGGAAPRPAPSPAPHPSAGGGGSHPASSPR